MIKKLLMAPVLLGALILPVGAVKHKSLWIDRLGAYEDVVRDAVAVQGAFLNVAETRAEADIVLMLAERGADYTQILMREKLGRRDARSLVAKDARTGKVLVRENVAPAKSPSQSAATRFAERIVGLN